jgi:hypothetical protein
MEHARIRWRNVGRVAAGVGAGGLLIAFAPGLLEPPDPPPLPADVGLATGATGAAGPYALAAPRPRRDRAAPRAHREPDPVPDSASRGARPTRARHGSDRDPATPHLGPEASPPAAPVAAPTPAPVPAAAAPPAAPAAPAPPEASPSLPHDPPAPPPPHGPSQFGFEH